MEGVRLHHPELRSVTYVVETPRRYKVPWACPACSKVHERKTYHLRLDSEGDVIVSQEIHKRLKRVDSGLLTENAVASPPPQTISLNGMGSFTVIYKELPAKKRARR